MMPFYVFTHNTHVLYLFYQILKESIKSSTSFGQSIFPFILKKNWLKLSIMKFIFLFIYQRLIEIVFPIE
jgi:hypothetical protein